MAGGQSHAIRIEMHIPRVEGQRLGQFRRNPAHLLIAHAKGQQMRWRWGVVAGLDMPVEIAHASLSGGLVGKLNPA